MFDGHVHSEWSWDTARASMERTCARAVELGLSAVAFTEHADPTTGWTVLARDLRDYPQLLPFVTETGDSDEAVGGILHPPTLDVVGYFDCLERCRRAFPDLRVISGVELGEPHRNREAVDRLLSAGPFERVIGSLHSFPFGDQVSEMPNLFRQLPPDEVVTRYLAELVALIEGSDVFSVLGHIDYVLRYWPATARPFDIHAHEEEFRHVLHSLAAADRVLEVNTRGQLPAEVVRWWREEGGRAVEFGSDAHDEDALARGFEDARAMVEAAGFRRGSHTPGTWIRAF